MEFPNRGNSRTVNLYLNYDVSNIGRVRSVKTGRLLKPCVSGRGHYDVSLCDNGKVKKHKIHRLAAQEFIEN